jgi:hypothetical protein
MRGPSVRLARATPRRSPYSGRVGSGLPRESVLISAEAFAVAAWVDQIVAVGVNCRTPDDVLAAIGIARGINKH